jgi:hypothetical protein
MFREVLSKGDYTSFPDVEKTSSSPERLPKGSPEGLSKGSPAVKDTKSTKSSEELNRLLDSLLSGSSSETSSETKDPFEGMKPTGKIAPVSGSTTKETKESKKVKQESIADFIDTTSKVYKDNKSTIDSILSSINEKSINDGSWLTNISSMEIPQIRVWQEIIKNTPLSFNETNNDDLKKILEGKEDLENPYSTILKLFVNPDKVGQLATGRFKQAGDDISEFVQKLTGTYSEPVDTTALDAKKTLDVRRQEEEEREERERAIAKLRGDEPPPTEQPTMSSDDYLSVPDLGYKPNTAWDDVKQFLGNIFTPQQLKRYGTQEEFEKELKKQNPEKYKEYQDALDTYDYRLRKVKLTEDSNIDKHDFSKIQGVASLVDRMLREASSAKDLTNSQIEEIYDIHNTLLKASRGSKNISYKQLGQLLNFLPQDMITKYGGEDWSDKITSLTKELGPQVSGDSDLSSSLKVQTSTGDQTKTEEEPKEEEPEEETKEEDPKEEPKEEDKPPDKPPDVPKKEIPIIKEKPLDTGVSNFSTLRPRMEWGGTDSMFFRKKDEVAQANLIAESMTMDPQGWGNGPDNPLYKRNLIQDDMRYGRTFSMPKPPEDDPLELPSKFIQMTQPIMVSQYAPTDRTLDDSGRDPYLFGQYQTFTPSYTQTVYPAVEQKVLVNEFPYVADLETGGETQEVKLYNYLQNLRFVG